MIGGWVAAAADFLGPEVANMVPPKMAPRTPMASCLGKTEKISGQLSFPVLLSLANGIVWIEG